MKYGKGIVKKYIREYNRTLKNGERKKYTTEQIQITVPKTEDIYEKTRRNKRMQRRKKEEGIDEMRRMLRDDLEI